MEVYRRVSANVNAGEGVTCDVTNAPPWDMVAHWLRRHRSTGGSWVRIPL